jgi:hypothetical protein
MNPPEGGFDDQGGATLMRLRKRYVVLAALIGAIAAISAVAFAGSPHQVGTCTVTQSGNTLTITGCKEAGLGGEAQINVTIKADALCINSGGNHPKAVNKTSATSTIAVPVQNGKAEFGTPDRPATLTATFQPDCSPPMTVQFTNISIVDTTNSITLVFTGP